MVPKNIFDPRLLPAPGTYYHEQDLTLSGGGEWRSSLCPFHDDTNPSLRIHIGSGGFKCMACGAHGGDVLAFHMQKYQLPFIQAVKQLGAWRSNQ